MKKVFILGCLMMVLMMTISRVDFSSEIEPDIQDSSIETILVHSFSLLNNAPIGEDMGAYNAHDLDVYRVAVQAYVALKDQNVSQASLRNGEIILKEAYDTFLNSRKALQSELDHYNKKLEEARALIEREEAGTGVFFTPEAYYALVAGLKDLKYYETGELINLNTILNKEKSIQMITESYLTPRRLVLADEGKIATRTLTDTVVNTQDNNEKIQVFRDNIEKVGSTYKDIESSETASQELLNEIITLANLTIAGSGEVVLEDDQFEQVQGAVIVKPALDDVRKAVEQVKIVEEEIENLTREHVSSTLDQVIKKTVTIKIPEDISEVSSKITLSEDVVDLLRDNEIDRVRLELGKVSFELSNDFLQRQNVDRYDFSAEKEEPLSENAAIENDRDTEPLGLPVYDLTATQDNDKNEAFEYPLALTFDLSEIEAIGKDELFVVHRLNEESQVWEPVYGFYDPVLKRMVVRRGHLSKYTVLKSTKNLSQIEDSWAKEEIAALVGSGVIDGNNLLDPKGSVSREEFSNWIVKAYGLEAETLKKGFDDISEDNPYYESVVIAYELGIVTGYEDGSFKPEADITKDELAMMIGSAIEAYNQTVNTESFELSKYEEDLPEWAIDSIETVVENGLTTEDYFVVDGAVTIEEAASILYNVNNIYR